MDTVAVVCAGVVVAVAVIGGLAVRHFRADAESRPRLERKRPFSGGEMLMRKAKFGHKGVKGQPPQRAYRPKPKLLQFRKLKQLEQPTVRAGDIDFWAAKKGVGSRSEALRLLVGMAINTNRLR